jgi:hypothetical protein
MYLETSHNLISSCSFHHNQVNGLSLYNGFPNQSIDSNTITCCRFYSNGLTPPASSGFGAGLVIGCGRGTLAFNNLIYGNNNSGGAGVFIDSFSGSTNTKSVTFVNNTIYDNAGFGLYIENISSGIIVRNNIIYSNGTDYSDNAADTVADHNLTTNPSFTNGSTAVYSLSLSASTSAAVDAGYHGEHGHDRHHRHRPSAGLGVRHRRLRVHPEHRRGQWPRLLAVPHLGEAQLMAIAFVTTAKGIDTYDGTTATTQATATWNLANLSRLIVVGVRWASTTSGITITSVTDTAGNTYVDSGVGQLTMASSVGYIQMYYCNGTTATNAANAVTVTFSSATDYKSVVAAEYSGANPTAAPDVTQSGTNPSATTCPSGSFTPSTATGVAVAVVGHGPAETGTYTAGTNYTKRDVSVANSGDHLMLEDRLLAPNSAQTADATSSVNFWHGLIVAVFKLATPTRFYFPSSSAAPAISPTGDAGWNNTASMVRRLAVTTKTSTAMASVTITETATNPEKMAHGQFIYGPLAAQNITGSIKGQFRCLESVATVNANLQVGVRVIASDGTTVRTGGLSVTGSTNNAATPPEITTAALTNRRLLTSGDATPLTLTDVVAQAGDYLVIEIGHRNASGGTSATVGISFGDNSATDLAENDTPRRPTIRGSSSAASSRRKRSVGPASRCPR